MLRGTCGVAQPHQRATVTGLNDVLKKDRQTGDTRWHNFKEVSRLPTIPQPCDQPSDGA